MLDLSRQLPGRSAPCCWRTWGWTCSPSTPMGVGIPLLGRNERA